MSTSLNIVNLPSKATGAGSASAGAQGVAAGKTGGEGESGIQSLFEVLLELTANFGKGTGEGDDALSMDTLIEQSGSLDSSFDLGGLIDFKAQLDSGNAETDLPDALAAILDGLLGALQKGLDGLKGGGDAGGLTGAGAQALDELAKMLDKLSAQFAAPGGDAAKAQLPAAVADQLKALSDLLAQVPSATTNDPKLAELQAKAAALLGTNATEAAKAQAASGEGAAETVASLLGKSEAGGKSASSSEIAVHTLSGARADLKTETPTPGSQQNGADQRQPAPQQQNAAPSSAAMAAAAAAADIGSNSDPDAPVDPLLAAQTTARDISPAALRPANAAYAAPSKPINMPMIAFEIARHAQQGISRFQIRLDPPEMGRIDVRLDLDGNGGVHARLTVDRAETLDMLQRDARALERALAQSGMDGAKTNLEFSLRQNPFAQQDFGRQNDRDFSGLLGTADEDGGLALTPETAMPPPGFYRGYARPGGINVLA